MVIGAFMAMATGMTMPLFSYIFGEMTDSFKPKNGVIDSDDVVDNAV